MYCDKCKFEVSNTMKICPSCGNRSFVDSLGQIQKTTTSSKQSQSMRQSRNKINSSPQEPRPWVRLWAKYIDLMSFGFIFGFTLVYIGLGDWIFKTNDGILGIFFIMCWVPLDALILSRWGTTPGRALLKTKIIHRGNDMSFLNLFYRSLKVYVRGFGLGLPIVNFITFIVAYLNLKKNKVTSWDQEGDFEVIHEKIGVERLILTILIIVAVIYFIWFEGQPGQQHTTY